MENKDFIIEDGVLEMYLGAGGDVIIPDNVTDIGYGAFEDCTGLTSIVIPDGVTAIGMGVFSGCTELKSITIPDSVTEIAETAFDMCENLTIRCAEGSSASRYAAEYSIPFEAVENEETF